MEGLESFLSGDIVLSALVGICLVVYVVEKYRSIKQPHLDEQREFDRRLSDLEKWKAVVDLNLSQGKKEFQEIKDMIQKTESMIKELDDKTDKRFDRFEERSDDRYDTLNENLRKIERAVNGSVLAGIGSAD